MVHHRIHKSPPLVPILSQMYQVHTIPSSFCRIHANIIPPLVPRSSLPFRSSDQNLICIHLACVLPDPPISSSIWSPEYLMKHAHELCSSHAVFFSLQPLLPLRSKNCFQHPALRHPQSISTAWKTVFHTHTKQQVKSVLLTLIFNFSKRRREDKMGEADDSPPSRGEVKNAWSYTSMPKRAFTAWFLFRHKTRLHDVVLS
jgi:hypothetical protein